MTVNGASRTVPAGSSVAELLAVLGFESRHVAVERNTALVPRERHEDERLADGDTLEIVTFLGGG